MSCQNFDISSHSRIITIILELLAMIDSVAAGLENGDEHSKEKLCSIVDDFKSEANHEIPVFDLTSLQGEDYAILKPEDKKGQLQKHQFRILDSHIET